MAVSLRHALAQALVVCGMVAVCPSSMAPVSFAASGELTTCAELRAWAEGFRDAAPSLDQFARFDQAQRRAIFGSVTPAVRAALWREQLTQLAEQPRWASTQHALFQDAMTVITTEVYERRPAALEALAVFRHRVDAAFTEPTERRVWFELGGVVTPGTATARVPYCDCNLAAQDCWGGALCANVACDLYSPGCGFAGASVCNGRCAW